MLLTMKSLLFLCSFTKLLIFVTGANILAVQIVPTKSYANIMSSIIKNLAPQHQITYYSITDKKYDHVNVTLKHIPQPEHIYMEQANIFEKMLTQDDTSTDTGNVLMSLTPEYVENFLKMEIFQELIHLKPKYDVLIMCYSLAEYFIPFAYHLDVPLIQIATTAPFPWQNDAIGNPNFLSYDNSLLTPESPDSFLNRLKKYIKHIIFLTLYTWRFLPSINEVTNKYFPPNTPSIETISKNTSLLFVNTNEAMGYSRPSLSNYVEIGGLHCTSPKPLPKDLEEFMQGSGENGVVYFSLGSTFQAQIPDRVLKAFINVFSKLSQRVIWKVNADMEGLPENIKALRWCPQQDILGHNKTKLFITQGGMLSLQETVYHGIPVLVIPIAFDQPINAKTVQKLGYGRHLPLNKFTEDTLFSELQEILTNPRYKQKAEEISSLFKDVQVPPAHKLKWWVNYIIRHKGFPIHRPKDDRYSWTKSVDIDILIFLQLSFLFTLITTVILMLYLMQKLNIYNICMKNKTKTL